VLRKATDSAIVSAEGELWNRLGCSAAHTRPEWVANGECFLSRLGLSETWHRTFLLAGRKRNNWMVCCDWMHNIDPFAMAPTPYNDVCNGVCSMAPIASFRVCTGEMVQSGMTEQEARVARRRAIRPTVRRRHIELHVFSLLV
jgi:hypothetical protein